MSTEANEQESEATQSSQEPEYLGMSDEDFLNQPTPTEDLGTEEEEEEDAASGEEGSDHAESQSGGADDGDSEGEETDESDGADDDASGESEDGSDDSEDADDSDSSSDDDAETGDKPDTTDFESFYKDVTSEFKASGRNMRVETAEDVKRLMQMGVDYNRKMVAMRPALKTMKMLEKNDLLDEEKLSFLVDLNARDPKAIAKLLADSEINPLEFDLEQGNEYTAPDRSVDDREIALDEVVSELKESPNYQKTINLVSSVWDDQSKQIVANEPQLIKVIDSHMASGIYDIVSNEVARERVLGRLTGVSDLEAYQQIGDRIQARGGFDHLNPSQEQGQQNPPPKPDTPAKPTETEQARRQRRKAAASAKPAASKPSGGNQDFNPLAMSDEDYLKQFDSKFT